MGPQTSRIAVVRPAFMPAGEQQPALSSLLAPLGGHSMALAAATQEPAGRVVVDEYERSSPSSPFSLRAVSTELAAYLKRAGVRTALVPDVAAAAAAAAPSAAVAAARAGGVAQSTNRCLMVAPTAFVFNEQAAQDNSFMHSVSACVL